MTCDWKVFIRIKESTLFTLLFYQIFNYDLFLCWISRICQTIPLLCWTAIWNLWVKTMVIGRRTWINSWVLHLQCFIWSGTTKINEWMQVEKVNDLDVTFYQLSKEWKFVIREKTKDGWENLSTTHELAMSCLEDVVVGPFLNVLH